MPNLRSKTWTTTTLAYVEDAQYWEDHLISDENAAKAAGAVQDAFKTIEVQSGGSTTNVVANKEDAITLEAGTNITLTATGKNIRINSTGGGGGGGSYTASKGIIISDSDIEADLKDYDLSSEEATAFGSTANRTYAVGLDSNGDLAVNVPWTDINFPANTKLGAHNLLPNNVVTQTKNTVLITHNSNDDDDTVFVNGTNSGALFAIDYVTKASGLLKKGMTYTFSSETDLPTKNGVNQLWAQVRSFNSSNVETGIAQISGTTKRVNFTIPNDSASITVRFVVDANAEVSNYTLKLMITAPEDTDPIYAPHAMTNRELTEVVDVTSEFTATSGVTINASTTSVKKIGKHIYGVIRLTTPSTVSANAAAVQMSAKVMPVNTNNFPLSIAYEAWKPNGECMIYVSNDKMLLAGSAWTASKDIMIFVNYFTK